AEGGAEAGAEGTGDRATEDVRVADIDAAADAVLDRSRRSATLGLQQLSGGIMAKGVEDTAWYRLAGPLAFCEVGGDPGRSRHDAVARWHARGVRRVVAMHGLVPSTTHDTKRALDVRCRLYALSEMSAAFDEGLDRLRRALGSRSPLGVDDELTYETRVLAQLALAILPPLPRAPQVPPRPAGRQEAPGDAAWPREEATLAGRLGDALVKGAREAKRRSSWQAPDDAYEARLRALAAVAMDDGGSLLRSCFGPVVDEVIRLGAVCSLSAVVLRHSAPGIPDCYQGDEVWNLSLVDPDNRRAVDFEVLSASLDSPASSVPGTALRRRDDATSTVRDAEERRRTWRDGTVKLLVTARCLAARRGAGGPALGPAARYHPLAATGPSATSVLAFAREASVTGGTAWAVPVVTRLPGRLAATGDDLPVGPSYRESRLPLPDDAPDRFVDALTGREVRTSDGGVALDEVLGVLPVALLVAAPGPGFDAVPRADTGS
ncbi:MAG: hypothetical protein ACRDWE_02875, partial [Acidimicrobiales bacterium]